MLEAIGPATVAVAAFASNSNGANIAVFAAAAQQAGRPLIVDAAMALPPAANLCGLVAAGADLVAFSGGKELRGPQAAGPVAAVLTPPFMADVFSVNAHCGIHPVTGRFHLAFSPLPPADPLTVGGTIQAVTGAT